MQAKLRAVWDVVHSEGFKGLNSMIRVKFRGRKRHWYGSEREPTNPSNLRELRGYYRQQLNRWSAAAINNPPAVATLISTNRPHRLPGLLRTLADQQGVELEIIIATHGFEKSDEMQALAASLGLEIRWLPVPKSLTLGEVYNEILSLVHAPYVAKIDDDDWYGSDYMLGSVSALSDSGADIVGKKGHFVYFEADDSLYLRFPEDSHKYVASLAGGTITTTTKIARRLGFSSATIGEDKYFLARARRSGMRVYSASPFGYALFRGNENTWAADQAYLTQGAKFIRKGAPIRIATDTEGEL